MIHLEKINWDNYEDVLKLHVSKEQDSFVAPNYLSLANAYIELSEGVPVHAYAIKADDLVVGFIMMGYDDDWSGAEHEEWLKSDIFKKYNGTKYYYIWRFMIGEEYQRKGYGKEALKQAIEFLKTRPDGDANYITLSYEKENIVAKRLYFSLGFYEPEEFAKYYEENDEIVALLKI